MRFEMAKVKGETKNHSASSEQASNQITKMDSSLCSEQVLQKLSTIEDLLKRKDDRPLTFKEACTYLGYAPSYLYKLTYKNIVPHYKPTGKIIFFSKNELDEWIFSSAERRVQNAESKEDVSASLDTKDPNQIEMDLAEEVVIEFPLKSRRNK
jgi:excisionase family DNA binding protein